MLKPALACAALATLAACSRPPELRHAPGPEGLAADIRAAILRKDVPAFVSLLGEGGLRCGDAVAPKAKVAAELAAGAGLYPGLFDSTLMRQRFGAGEPGAVSYREFFQDTPDARPTIEGGPGGGYLCWRPTCGPSSSLWRFEYVCDAAGRCAIVGVGC
jgi:hypothetical protein